MGSGLTYSICNGIAEELTEIIQLASTLLLCPAKGTLKPVESRPQTRNSIACYKNSIKIAVASPLWKS